VFLSVSGIENSGFFLILFFGKFFHGIYMYGIWKNTLSFEFGHFQVNILATIARATGGGTKVSFFHGGIIARFIIIGLTIRQGSDNIHLSYV